MVSKLWQVPFLWPHCTRNEAGLVLLMSINADTKRRGFFSRPRFFFLSWQKNAVISVVDVFYIFGRDAKSSMIEFFQSRFFLVDLNVFLVFFFSLEPFFLTFFHISIWTKTRNKQLVCRYITWLWLYLVCLTWLN